MTLLVLCIDASGLCGITEGQTYTVIGEIVCGCGKNPGCYELAETRLYPRPRRKWCKFCDAPQMFDRCAYMRKRFIRLNDPDADLRVVEKEKEHS